MRYPQIQKKKNLLQYPDMPSLLPFSRKHSFILILVPLLFEEHPHPHKKNQGISQNPIGSIVYTQHTNYYSNAVLLQVH